MWCEQFKPPKWVKQCMNSEVLLTCTLYTCQVCTVFVHEQLVYFAHVGGEDVFQQLVTILMVNSVNAPQSIFISYVRAAVLKVL